MLYSTYLVFISTKLPNLLQYVPPHLVSYSPVLVLLPLHLSLRFSFLFCRPAVFQLSCSLGLGVVESFFLFFCGTGTAGLSAFLARRTLLEGATYFCAAAYLLGIAYLIIPTNKANSMADKKREKRNEYLRQAVQENQTNAVVALDPVSRELDLRTLTFVQWHIELGLSGFDDWSYHDVIDQFQTLAVRYQLYEAVYCLGLYQAHYTPNFHGYLSEAQINVIYKSCTNKAMN
jgi:hypothetical protein